MTFAAALRLSLSLEVLGSTSARVAIPRVRELGYEAAGLPAWRRDFDPGALGASGARDLAAFLGKSGLDVSWLSAGARGRFTVSSTVAQDVERVGAMLGLAGRLRAGAAVARIGPLASKESAAAGHAREALAALALQADAAGSTLALCAAPGETALVEEMLAGFPDAPLGILLDPGMLLFAGRDPVDSAAADVRIAAVRASDASAEAADLAPGEGRVPWRDFLATLAARDYHGWATVDFAPRGSDAARAAQAAAVLRRFLP